MFVQKKNSPKQVLGKIRGVINPPNVMVKEASPNMKILRDVHIPMRDGSYLSANIYMPSLEGTFPTLLCLHPGRKYVFGIPKSHTDVTPSSKNDTRRVPAPEALCTCELMTPGNIVPPAASMTAASSGIWKSVNWPTATIRFP